MLVFLLFNHFRLLNFHICGHNLVGNLSLHVCDFLNPPVGVSKKEYCTEKRKAPVVSAWRKNGVIFCLVANESLFIYALKTLCDSTAQSSLLCRKNLPFWWGLLQWRLWKWETCTILLLVLAFPLLTLTICDELASCWSDAATSGDNVERHASHCKKWRSLK